MVLESRQCGFPWSGLFYGGGDFTRFVDNYGWVSHLVLQLPPLLILFRCESAKNEDVNSFKIVGLETLSTETGIKDFITVGTSIN